jgi:hypothetical protein
VHREREEFRKLGVQPVVVGHSNLRYAKAFLDDTKIELPVYVDEKRVVYKALEFKRPILTFFNPSMLKRGAEARKEGFTQPGVFGDAFQLGGVVLLMPDGSMPYRYASQFAGDHPKLEDLKAEVRKAVS